MQRILYKRRDCVFEQQQEGQESRTLRKRKLVSLGSPAPTQVVHTTSALCSTSFSVARCKTRTWLHVGQHMADVLPRDSRAHMSRVFCRV